MKSLEYVVAPFMLRREKSSTSLGEDFVKKNVQTHLLSLNSERKEIYKQKFKDFIHGLKNVDSAERVRLIQQSIREMILFLNQADNSAKFIKLSEILKTVLAAGEKAVIFTQFKETAEQLKDKSR